ncbi:hypothetical protein [Marinomonas balearica]|nr:hypothetical protein [Marinomonas balearica]
MIEPGEMSSIDFSYVYVSLFLVVFFFFSGGLTRFFIPFFERNNFNGLLYEKKFFLFFLVFSIFFYVLNILYSAGSIPVDRFYFWKMDSFVPEEYMVFGVLMIYFPALVSVLFNRKSTVFFYMSLYFFYLYISGQKFHGFLVPFALFIAVFKVHCCFNRKEKIFFLLASVLVVLIAAYDVSKRGIAKGFEGFLDPILYRFFALQGAAFKSLYQECFNGIECSGLNFMSSMSDVVIAVLNKGGVDAYLEKGVNLSVGIFHLPFTDGFLGVISVVFFAIISSAFLSYFYVSVSRRSLLDIFFCSYGFIWMISIAAQGSIAYSLKKLLMLFVILLGLFFVRKISSRC